jgi:hypothetical protein
MSWRSCAGAPTAHGPRRRDSRAHRRLSHRRLHLSLAIRREHLHPHSRPARRLSVERLDANGLLRTAIRCDDPVLFLEHKRLYRETYGRAPYPGPDFAIPFGKAKIVRPARHHAGHLRRQSCPAPCRPRSRPSASRASTWKSRSAHAQPLRLGSHRQFGRKTSRVIVAHEDMLSWGYGAEIAARIADELFDSPRRPGPPHRLHGHLSSPTSRCSKTRSCPSRRPSSRPSWTEGILTGMKNFCACCATGLP